jgi:glucose-1-phosphate thymidylyltransferase
MEIAKALILAGGGGDDRPWPVVAGSRHLFPIANRPILFHNLEALRAGGILEATILSEPATASAIERAVGDGRDWGMTVRHVDWNGSDGVHGALAAGRDFLGDEPVLVEHGDALLRERMHVHISAFARERLDALALRLERGAERTPRHLTPGYLLSPRAISILLDQSASKAGPVARLRASGGRVRVQAVDGCLPCHGDIEALIEGNRRMLEAHATSVDAASLQDTTVQGPVEVHPTARICRSLLRGPVIVGPGARVTDAYIGPYTSIGADVVVEGSEIEHSIVLPEAELRFVGPRLESSVIGRGARVVRGFDLPATMRVAVGDGAEVVVR